MGNKRILYIFHRYHTNLVPIMKGWYEEGNEVMFLATYEGVNEVHDYVRYHRLQPSLFTRLYNWYVDKTDKTDLAENKKFVKFIPSFNSTLRIIKDFSPDVVVIRYMYLHSLLVILVCKLLSIKKTLLYSQAPLYRDSYPSVSFAKRVIKGILYGKYLKASFTPVLYRGRTDNIKKEIPSYATPQFFVPMISETVLKHRDYCSNGIIHILDVGKYRDYKNHFL